MKTERLTPADSTGSHDYDIAPGAKWAFHTSSTMDTPPVVDIVRHPDARKTTRSPRSNAAMRSLLQETPHVDTEFFRVDIGEATVLDAWMIKPPDFDPAKKYPLLMYVYSRTRRADRRRSLGRDRHLWHLMLAQRGYLIASVDSRGAAAPRGREWRRSIYRQIGILASADQAAAITQDDRGPALHRRDANRRVGLEWRRRHDAQRHVPLPAAVSRPASRSRAPSTSCSTTPSIRNDTWGCPPTTRRGYRDGSPINFAQNLQGNLLIVHGTGDDNVHYQNAEQLVNRLIGLNKRFSMMAYPDRTHGIGEGSNTRLHLFDLATRFLEDASDAVALSR